MTSDILAELKALHDSFFSTWDKEAQYEIAFEFMQKAEIIFTEKEDD